MDEKWKNKNSTTQEQERNRLKIMNYSGRVLVRTLSVIFEGFFGKAPGPNFLFHFSKSRQLYFGIGKYQFKIDF